MVMLLIPWSILLFCYPKDQRGCWSHSRRHHDHFSHSVSQYCCCWCRGHSNRFLLSASKERVTRNGSHRKFLETTNSELLAKRTWKYTYKDIYICCRQIEIQVHISIFGEQVTKRDNQNELSYKYSNPLLPQRLIQTKQFWAFLLGITAQWEGSPLINQIWQ